MIFKQWQQVLDGTKMQTRRLVKDGQRLVDAAWGADCDLAVIEWYRTKWSVGRTYAVQPGYGLPAIWIGPDGTLHDTPLAEYLRKARGVDAPRCQWGNRVKAWLQEHGYREARIRVTGIRKERVQDISEEDARAEGARIPAIVTANWSRVLNYRAGFETLWDSIHKKAGRKWADNPEVWVLEFEAAQEAGA